MVTKSYIFLCSRTDQIANFHYQQDRIKNVYYEQEAVAKTTKKTGLIGKGYFRIFH